MQEALLEAVWVHFRSHLELIFRAVRRVLFVPISEQHLPRLASGREAEGPERAREPPREYKERYIYVLVRLTASAKQTPVS